MAGKICECSLGRNFWVIIEKLTQEKVQRCFGLSAETSLKCLQNYVEICACVFLGFFIWKNLFLS